VPNSYRGNLPRADVTPSVLTYEMVETGALPQNGTAWGTARGRMGIWVPSPTVLVLALRGHGDVEFGEPILTAFNSLSKRDNVYLFIDADGFVNYQSQLRTQLTTGFFPHRRRLSVQILLSSKLVAIGVSVANLALGGIVTTLTDRARFKANLDARLFENRVVGFSSSSVDALRFDAA
jgi:hypothetical protein